MAQQDSAKSIKIRKGLTFRAQVSASYMAGSTITETYVNHFNFNSYSDLNLYSSSPKFKKQLLYRGSLSFENYPDSSWFKTSDSWRVSARYTENLPKQINHSYSIVFNSQFLDSYNYFERDGELEKVRKGNFFNPGTILISYGLMKSFWDICWVNFAFANIKIYTRPRFTKSPIDTESFAKTKYAKIYTEYGLSISSFIEKEFSSNVFFENSSNIYVGAVNRDKVNLECINGINFRFLRFLNLKILNQLTYDPFISYHLLIETRFSLGVVLDFRNSRLNPIDLRELSSKN